MEGELSRPGPCGQRQSILHVKRGGQPVRHYSVEQNQVPARIGHQQLIIAEPRRGIDVRPYAGSVLASDHGRGRNERKGPLRFAAFAEREQREDAAVIVAGESQPTVPINRDVAGRVGAGDDPAAERQGAGGVFVE